ncbi:NBS-LRR type resistance protein [Cucumis melo var. makuwa]|uniref:NBS-LRR type resistance protein n=1 Tax=Cucumis melo var. makuwa TaxID=1194695 RepID=A0A5A7TY42_CUCMM|nr:NBS-LRR type resistance protein [Cucumis melo var. makuwa]TYK23042.1 NBS-LRR type resistance protein [Cucumis melo var. makuwa]
MSISLVIPLDAHNQSSDSEGCTNQSRDLEGCTYQSSDPEGCTYQSNTTKKSDVGTIIRRNTLEDKFPMHHQQGIGNNLLQILPLPTSSMRRQQVIPDVHSFDVRYVLEIMTPEFVYSTSSMRQ